MTTWSQRVRGLVACLALLALVVGFPAVLVAIGYAPWDADLDELQRMLSRADDGSLAFAAFAAIGWGAWVVMTGSVLLAVAAEVRRVPSPSVPGLALPQAFAARLVGIAALLFIAGPAIAVAAPAAPAHSTAAAPVAHPDPATTRQEAADDAPAKPTVEAMRTRDYTVVRGDSLWRIADRLLGDGARYSEIVELNAEVLGGHPDFITPGTVLKVPDEPSTQATVVVESGDTLSEIAAEELGDADRYPEIFAASRETTQPDGEHLTDPDLIRPGWTITLPGDSEQPLPQAETLTEPEVHSHAPSEVVPSPGPEP